MILLYKQSYTKCSKKYLETTLAITKITTEPTRCLLQIKNLQQI